MTSTPRRLLDRIDIKEAATGALLLVVAGWFAATALRSLALGSPARMGPGFFPLMVSAGLAAMGMIILAGAFGRATETTGFVGARALLCVLASPLLFAFTVAPLGFAPSIALTALLAAYGSRLMSLRFALALSAILTLLSTALFVKLLRMPVQSFGPLLGF